MSAHLINDQQRWGRPLAEEVLTDGPALPVALQLHGIVG